MQKQTEIEPKNKAEHFNKLLLRAVVKQESIRRKNKDECFAHASYMIMDELLYEILKQFEEGGAHIGFHTGMEIYSLKIKK